MLFTWLIGIAAATLLVAAFWSNIKDWAISLFNNRNVQKAKVYIKQKFGEIKVFFLDLLGLTEETYPEPLTVEQIYELWKDGVITTKQRDDMLEGKGVSIMDINR